jgi:hypothetical protein
MIGDLTLTRRAGPHFFKFRYPKGLRILTKRQGHAPVMGGVSYDHFFISKWSKFPSHIKTIIEIAKCLICVLNLTLVVLCPISLAF